MPFLFAFVLCLILALINVPFYLQTGSIPNLISIIFCGGMAVFNMVMAAVALLDRNMKL